MPAADQARPFSAPWEPGTTRRRPKAMYETKRPLRSLLLAVPALGLLAAGCGAVGATDDVPTADPPPTEQAVSDETVVVRLELGGGYEPVLQNLRTVPAVTITADGAIYAPGPVPAIFPGPAAPSILVGVLDDRQVESVLDLVDELGLDATTDFGVPTNIADAPTVTLDVLTDDGPIILRAYALGLGDETNDELTDGQRSARAAFSSVVDAVTDLVALDTTEGLVPDGYRVWAGPYDEFAVPGGDLAVEPVEWPLDDRLLGVGGDRPLTCSMITGADADALGDVIPSATEITPWTASDGSTFALAVSPLYPGVEPCPVVQNDAVVRVVEAGGFAPVAAAVSTVPSVTIDEHLTIYAPAGGGEPWPGPAVAPVLAGEVTDDEVEALRERARALGLAEEGIDFGLPNVTDLPTTTVTIDLGERVVAHAAYALGFEDDTGLTDAQRAARAALSTYVDELEALAAGRATAPYAPTAYALYAFGTVAEEGDEVIDWPLPSAPVIDPSSLARSCTEVVGTDARALGPVLAGADVESVWAFGDGTTFTLVGRPLLTAADDRCPQVDAAG